MERDLLKNLYCRYARELYLYLYSLCRSHAMAEDLLQEVFLKALLPLSESHGNMRAWLYLVARNLCLNQMKRPGGAMMKKKKSRRVQLEIHDILEPAFNEVIQNEPRPGRRPRQFTWIGLPGQEEEQEICWKSDTSAKATKAAKRPWRT